METKPTHEQQTDANRTTDETDQPAEQPGARSRCGHELGQLVMRNPNQPQPFQLGTLTTTDDVAGEVRTVVDEQVNPALAAHGGFVTFMGHDGEGKVYLTMGGGCHGCSMSRMTMLQGVQTMIMEAVPAITKVIDATDHTTGENPYFS